MNLRKLAIAALLVAPFTFSTSANAVDVATVVGTGTISPGLPLEGCANQDVTFSSTATVNAGDHTGTYSFTFTGQSSICETLQLGEGSGLLSGDLTGSVDYARSGSHVTVTGSVSIGGDTATITAGECTFHATSVDPVESYALNCHVVLS